MKKKIPNHAIKRAIELIDNKIILRNDKYNNDKYKKCICCKRVYINETKEYCNNCNEYINYLKQNVIFNYNQKINKILKENVIK